MSSDISMEALLDEYQNWKVGTSTSLSGRHLSHLHALFQPHGLTGDSNKELKLYEETKQSMWHAHHACVQNATKHSFCFPRWRQVVNAMIEKESGNPSKHRRRVIHLYKNDYNLIFGIKFWELLHKCLDKGCIRDGCFGSWANRQSLDPVFLEVMQYNYTQLTHFESIKFSNDAG